jgi:hypothetical protein
MNCTFDLRQDPSACERRLAEATGLSLAILARDGDGDEAGRVPVLVPGGQGLAEFGGAAVVDLGGADGKLLR